MNGYNFTERVRKVLAMAPEEAARLHHEYVGTEHILLGLIREGEGVAATVLQNLDVDLGEVPRRIEAIVKRRSRSDDRAGPPLYLPGKEGTRARDGGNSRSASLLRGNGAPSSRTTR